VAVGRICRLVDGMPLGIELAANWVRVLSCEAIADEIERSLDILETPARNIESRHRTMRAAFAPTWNRLSEDERAVFMKLSVFRGGFTRAAAEQVAGASLRTLSALLDKSLLRVDTNGRYDLHELLRQYGEDQLDASPEDAVQTRDRQCDYYATLLEAAWPRLTSSEIKVALKELDLEVENIRTMWAWALRQHYANAIEKALTGLSFFYDLRAREHEGEQAYGRAAAVFSDSAPESIAIRAKLLARQGGYCHDIGLIDKASALLLESVEILRRIEAHRDLANALLILGILYEMIESDMSVAAGYYQESVAIFAQLGDRSYMGLVLQALAHCYGIQGAFEQALAYGQESLALFQEIGSFDGMGAAYNALGSTTYQLGQYQQCKTYIEKSLALNRESGSFIGIIFAMGIISAACSALGEYDQARNHVLDGLQTYRDSGQVQVDRFTLGLMAIAIRACLGDGEIERGYELMGLVDREFRRFGTHRKFWAWSILDHLDEDLPPNLIAAVERGRAWNLEAAMQTLMDDFSRSLEKNAAPRTLAIPGLLTERELEILSLIADGFSNSEIAEQIIFSTGTVKWYVHQILGKLDVTNRTQAVARARTLGLLP
ncbi:MAG: LuxR C-terminal-related transcriptional regulator, partial [Chloroflexota bacterium]